MRRRLARLLLAAGAAASAPAPLAAQQGQPAPDSTARVDSARPDSAPPAPRVHRLPAEHITGTRLSGAADERTPVQVDVVNLRDAPPGPDAAAEAVSRLPGVSKFDDQGTRAQPTLNVRGFTVSPVVGVPQGVSVFLDGVRVNEPDAQQVYFDLIPMDAVSHAELVRGPGAVYGKNTLAGALVLFTERGSATPRLEAEAEGGAFGYRGARLTAGGVRAGVDGFLMARLSDEDGYRVDTPARTRMVFGTVGRQRDSSDVALSVLAAHDRIYQAGSLPESWLRVDRRANYTTGDYFVPDLLHAALRGERTLLGARLRGNAFARRNATQQFNVNVADPNTRAFVRSLVLGGAGELSWELAPGGRALALTVGGEYARNDVRYRIYQEAHDGIAIDSTCDPARGLCESAAVDEDDAALYAQGALDVTGRLSTTASVRGDYVRIPFRDRLEPQNGGTSVFTRLSPRLGVNYRAGDDLRGYAAVSSGFRAPAALELACADEAAPCPLPFSLGDDPPLKPVVVWNYETGLDWEPTGGAAVDAVAFWSDVRDEIVFAAAERIAGFFQNVGRTRRQGVELSARAALPRNARVFASYTYLDATYRSRVRLASQKDTARFTNVVEPGDRFPLSPAHRATAGLGLTRLVGPLVLDGELSATAVSSQYLRGDEANETPPLPGYATANLHLAAEHARVALELHVTNLFDRKFETFGIYGLNPLGPLGGGPFDPTRPERFLNPGYPRAITVSVRARI